RGGRGGRARGGRGGGGARDRRRLEPLRRHEIKQRRSRNQIDRAVECKFEIAHQVDGAGFDRDVGRAAQSRRLREKTEVVIDEPPILTRRQLRADRPQRRAGAAAKVDDRDGVLTAKRRPDHIEYTRAACGAIVRFAQRQPLRRKAAHTSPSNTRANSVACSYQDGKETARAPAVSRCRSLRSSNSRRSAVASASTSSGGTRMPASRGTVSGIAPAFVPTTGTPYAIASA